MRPLTISPGSGVPERACSSSSAASRAAASGLWRAAIRERSRSCSARAARMSAREVLGEPQRPYQQRRHHCRVDGRRGVLVAAVLGGQVVPCSLGFPRRHRDAVARRQVRRVSPQCADGVERLAPGPVRGRRPGQVRGPFLVGNGIDVGQRGDAEAVKPDGVAAPVLGDGGDRAGARMLDPADSGSCQQCLGRGQGDQRPSGALEAVSQRGREGGPVDPPSGLVLAAGQRGQVPGVVTEPGHIRRAGAVRQILGAADRGTGGMIQSPGSGGAGVAVVMPCTVRRGTGRSARGRRRRPRGRRRHVRRPWCCHPGAW